MKKTLIGLGCVLALLTSCKEKTPEEKIQNGLEEIQEGTSDKAGKINKKTTDFLHQVKEDIKDGSKSLE